MGFLCFYWNFFSHKHPLNSGWYRIPKKRGGFRSKDAQGRLGVFLFQLFLAASWRLLKPKGLDETSENAIKDKSSQPPNFGSFGLSQKNGPPAAFAPL